MGNGRSLQWRAVRVDWEVARRGYARYAAYPAATLSGIFTNCVFGFLKGSILLAVLAHQSVVGGYDRSALLTFVWVTQALMMPVYMVAVWPDVALRIRSGDIATDLARPIDPMRYWLGFDLGRATYQLIYRGVPPFLVGALFFELRLPSHPLVWLAFVASVTLAVVASFGFRFAYNVLTFWLGDIRGIGLLALVIATLFSGFLVPLTFFPDWLETVARALPFAAMIQTPVDVFLRTVTGTELISALAGQAAWALGLLAIGRGLLSLGARRVVIQGG